MAEGTTQLAGLAPFLQGGGFAQLINGLTGPTAQTAIAPGAVPATPNLLAQQATGGITPSPTSGGPTSADNGIMSLIQKLLTGSSFGAGGDTAI